jgi:hypothetical protein
VDFLLHFVLLLVVSKIMPCLRAYKFSVYFRVLGRASDGGACQITESWDEYSRKQEYKRIN